MSFKFCSLASGSSGNSQYIETEHTKILVDCGLTGKATQALLQKIHVNPQEIDAIFVTHEHSDHVKGVGVLSRRFNIPILANQETWLGMEKKIGEIKSENTFIFQEEKIINFKDLDILPVKTSHDSENSCGYMIYKNRKKISLVTDTGIITDRLKAHMQDADLYFIEANHDIMMLKYGMYPYHLKKRILANTGHLSNIDCANLIGELLHGNNEHVLLAHLSQDNNTEKLSFDTVNEYLLELGLDTSGDVQLNVAPRVVPSEVIDLDDH